MLITTAATIRTVKILGLIYFIGKLVRGSIAQVVLIAFVVMGIYSLLLDGHQILEPRMCRVVAPGLQLLGHPFG